MEGAKICSVIFENQIVKESLIRLRYQEYFDININVKVEVNFIKCYSKAFSACLGLFCWTIFKIRTFNI